MKKKDGTKQSGSRLPLTDFMVKTICLLVMGISLFTLIFNIHRMTGNTMSPFVRDGDLCIFLRVGTPESGDVVIYEGPDGETCVGRIVATEGQTVDFPENGGFTVDGYPPVEEIPYETYLPEEDAFSFPITLEAKERFILNDFRALTDDGRSRGPLAVSRIKGKMLFLLRRRG
ncbi:MAG: signal peptidase I, partial [Lachnospiraceae bacterium]|nr:signal peptidase I [Lachnospiraceae bacterium]